MKIIVIVLENILCVKFLILTFNQLDTKSNKINSQTMPLDSVTKFNLFFLV